MIPRVDVGIAYGTSAVEGKWLEITRVAFVGYASDRDKCTNRSGVAIANEPAALGQGSGTASMALGSAMCYQCVTSDLHFVDTPLDGRLAFSPGNGGVSGMELDEEYGACTLYDSDGSLYGTGSKRLYKANFDQEWPEDVLEDCVEYAANLDDWPDMSKCPWFIRENDYLLSAASDATRRGYASPHDVRDDVNNDPCSAVSGVSADRHVSYCTRDFVTLKYTVPKRITSGSEVLWAPIAWSSVRFESIATSIYYEDETVVSVLPNYPVDSEAGQFASRWPQPFTHQVPNMGSYRIDWTGDVTAFSEDGDYTFQLLGTDQRPVRPTSRAWNPKSPVQVPRRTTPSATTSTR